MSTDWRAVGPGRAGVVALAVLLLGGSPLAAQSEKGNTWLRWTGYDVFVAADTVRGVGLWLHPQGSQDVRPLRGIDGDYYEPEDVLAWLGSVDSVLHARPPAPEDTRTEVATPLLPSLAGNGTLLFRKRDGAQWDRRPMLAFADSAGHVRVAIRAADATVIGDFLDALRTAAKAVGHRQPSDAELARDTRCMRESEITGPGAAPTWPIQIPTPKFPSAFQARGAPGRVLLSYVVDTTGRADPSSFVVLFASNRSFAEAAVAAIRKATFRPATFAGHPVRQCVQQKISFDIGRWDA